MNPGSDLRKIFILDTNQLVNNPRVIEDLGDNVIVVPFWVLGELDKLKRDKPLLAHAVRVAAREIERYRKKAVAEGSSLLDGVETYSGGWLIFDPNAKDLTKLKVDVEDSVDNRLLLITQNWNEVEEKACRDGVRGTPRPVILLTQDTLLKNAASALGFNAEDWQRDKLVERVELMYTGMATLELSPEQAALVPQLFKDKQLPISAFGDLIDPDELMPNQCLTLSWQGGAKTALAVFRKSDGVLLHAGKCYGKQQDWRTKIRPINSEQQFAYSLLKDPSIQLVSLTGAAGTGKTLMALQAAYEQVREGLYDRILVWRSTQVVGDGLGFYPGSIEEKFAPYAQPVVNAFQKVIGDADDEDVRVNYDRSRVESSLMTVEPILHVQGSTEDRVFLIIDEAQNLSPREMKALITRAGIGTKIVLTGDVMQVENRFLDELSNGLTYVVECWRDSERSGHVTLVTAERSELVEEAVQRMML